MKLIINEDNSHFYSQKPGKPAEAENIRAFIDQYENTCVTELFLCVNCMRASYDSKIFDPIWKGFDPNGGLGQPYFDSLGEEERKNFYLWPYNANLLNGSGKNVYCDWIGMCRERKISPWISMRMNDVHYAHNENHPIHSEFWRHHPERRRADYKSGEDNQLDFGREDVREYSLAFIREIADTFDMDGLELDWMRFGLHFKPGFEQQGVGILNQFTRDVRKILDAAEQKRGHKIGLAARVPSRPGTALGLGFDACAWACEDLVDLLIVTPFFATAETDMPIELWKQLLRGTKTKLAAGLEILIQPHPNTERLFNGMETLRGMAWSYLNRGADAIYLFNYMHTGKDIDGIAELYSEFTAFSDHSGYAAMLNEIGDIEAMRGKNRRHVVTYSDMWAPGEPRGHLLPAELNSGWSSFRIHIGEAPPKDQKAFAVIGIKAEDGADAFELRVNGAKCEKSDFSVRIEPVPPETQHSYEIPPGALHDGHNLVEMCGGRGDLVWVEINI
ncbi:MAG: hypothetical protein FWG34_08860 [Oscillospiraceae bacterium]|nr:hypothetical protein [Oscillospiraceae bacterium]